MSSVPRMGEQRARAIAPVRIWVGMVAMLLFALVLLAPWLAAHGWMAGAWTIQQFFSPVCHQEPMRSFWFWGAPAAVCARCFGIYLGATFGTWARVERRLAVVFAALLVANIADALSEHLGWHGSLPQVRFGLGVMLGVSISALIVSAATGKNPTRSA